MDGLRTESSLCAMSYVYVLLFVCISERRAQRGVLSLDRESSESVSRRRVSRVAICSSW